MHLLHVRISLFSYDTESANTTKILRKMNNRTLLSAPRARSLYRVCYNSFADLSILVIRKLSESIAFREVLLSHFNADLLSCHVSLPESTNSRKRLFDRPFHLRKFRIDKSRKRATFTTLQLTAWKQRATVENEHKDQMKMRHFFQQIR